MAAKKSTNTALQQKVKVLAKLYDSGCKTEKDLKALSLQSILKIPDISVSDMTVITELQEQIAALPEEEAAPEDQVVVTALDE